jgi:beta-glucosidase
VAGTPVLPLTGSELTRVAVLGRLASIVNLGDGGSSDVWAPDVVTALAGIEAALPHAEVVHHDGSNIEAAAGLAREADVALVVVGYTYADEGEFIGDAGVDLRSLMPEKDDPDLVARFEAETETRRSVDTPEHVRARRDEGGFARGGDRTSLRLREDEVALIHAVAAANPHVIVAIVAGSAVVLSEWDDEVPAIVQSWYAGMEGGHALADVLLGEIEVAGRLPFTVPASEEHLPAFDRDATHFVYDRWHGWWKLARDGNAPAYPFGFGLGYTTFDLVQAAALVHDGAITASASVLNTGARRGTEVVQVYARRVSDESPPRLIGFMRLEAESGATASASLSIPLAGLAERDTTLHSMVVIPGRYEVRFARSAVDEGVTIELEIN